MESSEESRSSLSVFGSPPEPIFNESRNGLSNELILDSLKFLSSKNEVAVRGAVIDETRGCFKSGQPVQFLFELSKHFKLPTDVQYRAAELFHHFMTSHIVELYQVLAVWCCQYSYVCHQLPVVLPLQHVQQSQQTSSPIQWSEVENRLKHQVILRAVSCVQLASKLSSHYNLVSLNRVKSFLTQCGFRYASTSLVQSEVRILKTLDFKVHCPTPLEYVETLLGMLSHDDPIINPKQLHGIALKVLDVYYIERGTIYEKLFQLTRVDVTRDQTTVAAIEEDFMLLAVAVISASSFILDRSQSELITTHLSQITRIVLGDILNFASVLLEEIFTANKSI